MSDSQEGFLIAPEVDENLSPEERLKIDRTFEKEITRLQRQYLNIANSTAASKDVHIMRCLEKKLKYLQREKNELKTKLKVAYAPCHVRRYDRQVQLVDSHVRVQEDLDLKMNGIRTEIRHLESQMKRLDKERKELQKVSQSDYFFYNRVSKAKKRLATLEDRLYHLKKREATNVAKNHKMKSVIKDMLVARKLFHQHWRKMIDQLGYDKKFLIDMIERTILAFNQGEELCHKIDAVKSHAAREEKSQMQEMMELQRRINNDRKNHEFLRIKGFHRDMCDLDPREVHRRNMMKEDYGEKLDLYERIIEKTKLFCGVDDIEHLIEKYQKQEDTFFAHFNYLNELNHQYEQLNCILMDLYKNVDDLKEQKLRKEVKQDNAFKHLHEKLLEESKKTQKLENTIRLHDSELDENFAAIDDILLTVGYDRADVKNLLGEHRKVTKQNVKRFLAALEVQLNDRLAAVYTHLQPEDEATLRTPIARDAKDIVRIEEVVTTQQCAECAEGQDVNKYDEAIVLPKEKIDIREGMKAKVRAPEMQYRLHNLSKCKLPRSRILVNKRYQ
ncbi:outer dynein arm-docking complex subunit 1-like [Armigeres subalbatus]|uniref:outer dynein arm-docking complex subunit 1-like n=1 Tax=Armigeres subalbatus TaxID=124917 RepID=UPI002ED65E7F